MDNIITWLGGKLGHSVHDMVVEGSGVTIDMRLAWTIHEMCDYRDVHFVHRVFCE